jgi:hypothetical protein
MELGDTPQAFVAGHDQWENQNQEVRQCHTVSMRHALCVLEQRNCVLLIGRFEIRKRDPGDPLDHCVPCGAAWRSWGQTVVTRLAWG